MWYLFCGLLEEVELGVHWHILGGCQGKQPLLLLLLLLLLSLEILWIYS
jgi:hypothetical protein